MCPECLAQDSAFMCYGCGDSEGLSLCGFLASWWSLICFSHWPGEVHEGKNHTFPDRDCAGNCTQNHSHWTCTVRAVAVLSRLL